MRKICLFNQDANSNITLNLFAQIARKGKTVLIIDLRFGKEENENCVGYDIYSMINSDSNPEKYLTKLEKNLFLIKGSSKLNLQEFNLFYDLFKLDYFEKYLKNLNYDYIIFEVSPQLNILTKNALFESSEVISIIEFEKEGLIFTKKLAKFISNFNQIYSKKLILSKIITIFKESLEQEQYVNLVSSFNSKIVSFPIRENKKGTKFAGELEIVAKSIILDSKIFKSNKKMFEYLSIISENSN